MTRSTIPTGNRSGPRRVSVAVEQACAMEADPPVKARMLRELAAWYRAFAARTANPVIWESRLLTADHLDAEADGIDPQQHDERTAL
jgi:hypothetical protein